VLHDQTAELTLTAFRDQSEVRTAALEPTYTAIVDALWTEAAQRASLRA
jgi:hypothetical protein